MAISTAAKVGAVTVAAILASLTGFAWLTNFSFGQRGYAFGVVYGDVAGLLEGASVMLMGVKVGQVEAVVPELRRVLVRVRVFRDDVKILESSRFIIASQGIIGEKSLEIFPPEKLPADPDFIQPGETVRGNDPQRLELVMEELTETFREYQAAIDPEKFAQIFEQTASNLVETTGAIARISTQAEGVLANFDTTLDRVDRVLIDTDRLILSADPEAIAGTVKDIRALSAGLLGTYNRVFGTREAQAEQAATLRNVYALSRQLERLAETLNQTAGDPAVQADIRATLRNIRDLTGVVREATNLPQAAQVGGVALHPVVQGAAAHTPIGTGLTGNLGLKAALGGNYLFGGIEQIGEGNYLDLMFGDDDIWGTTGFYAGLIRSKIGVGIDYELTPSISLMGQLYDPFRPTFRLGTTYFPLTGGQYGLFGQWARTFQTNENYIWLGLEWRPLNGSQPTPP